MIKQKRGRNKKAVFFSLDALIALIIIILSILVIYPIIRYSEKESYVPEDIISSLSALKIGEMGTGNLYVQGLIDNGNITNLNKSVLEQIGEFYVSNDPNIKDMARQLANEVLLTIDTNENIGIWYDDDLLASRNSTSLKEAKDVSVERQIISGIQEGNATTGYSARAFLSNSIQTKYFYFGGYVGEGNITINVEYNGTLSKVELEITANKQFKICINNNLCIDSLAPASSEFEPKYFNLSAHRSDFNPSFINAFKIVPADGISNLHVAGGYLKLTYSDGVQYEQPVRYYFPGIEGLINIYDGFYVPGQLNDLNVYLHFKSNYTAILTIGNETVYQTTPSLLVQEQSFTPSGLNYDDLSGKTIPVRLRLANVSYTTGTPKPADVVSVTDISGSMDDNCGGCNESTCVQAACRDADGCKICDAKDANKAFIDAVLNSSGNRVGLVGYSTNAPNAYYHALSTDNVSLKKEVNSWIADGSTCICCGINRAVNALNSSSGPEKFKSIVVMSDGEANQCCSNFNDYTGSSCSQAKQRAISSACNAWQNYSIKVYAIGFGSYADTATLQSIASCGNGSYYYANITNLVEVYKQIAQNIIEAAYKEQTIEFTGNISSILYPDSYIEFNYTKEKTPYGIVITEEKKFSDNYTGSFVIPENSTILETRAVSYSGARWTDNVKINGASVYDLSKYGSDYIKLGDPYTINIPNSYVQGNGFNNVIRLTTGTSPTNTSSGSSFNKIIYTVLKNMVSYSAISQYANGCNWTVQFEDDTYLTIEVPGATETCDYKNDSHEAPGSNDALQTAVYKLFQKLDSDNPPNGQLDIKFTEQNLQISAFEITGIPFPYETVVQVRKWW